MSTPSTPVGADSADRTDFENSDKGFMGALDPMTIKAADGRVVWEMEGFSFLAGDRPDTVHPSLWRQAQLTAKHGVYEVMDGIYQVRGFDMSNMTLVESDTGVIVIDPLISAETAAAAMALYREHRGDRAVTAVIYTHAHIDHFGGVLGVVDADTTVPIIAPGALPRARGVRERLRRHCDDPARLLLRRRAGAEGPDRHARHRPRCRELARHGWPDRADADDHHHRSGGGRGRSPDRLPDDARYGVPGRDELLLPSQAGALHGGERHSQPAQPAHPARGAGS